MTRSTVFFFVLLLAILASIPGEAFPAKTRSAANARIESEIKVSAGGLRRATHCFSNTMSL